MTKEVQEMNQSQVAVAGQVGTIDMPGLESMPTSWIPVPFVKLVLSNSQEVDLADGTRAGNGRFYYTNLQSQEDELKVAVLDAKPMSFTGPSLDDPSKIETKHSVGIIFYDLNLNKVFCMRIQPGSFAGWRGLVGIATAAFEAGDMTAFFSREVKIVSELVKEGARSWYALRFSLGGKLDETTFETASIFYEQYRGYFNSAEAAEEAE